MTSSPRPDYRQHLEIETPEHVVLDYEIAGVGSRFLAALLDTGILFILLVMIFIVFAVAGMVLGPGVGALFYGGLFFVWSGYYAVFEGFGRGQTPGKKALGIRVIRDTGHAVTFGEAGVRSLIRTVDLVGMIGIIVMMIHPRGKRLGDLVAGTVVVRDTPLEITTPTSTATDVEAAALGAPLLSEAEFQLLRGYIQRGPKLVPAARARIGHDVATRFSAHRPQTAGSDLHFLEILYREESIRRQGRFGARSHRRGGSAIADRMVARKRERWQEFQKLAARVNRNGLDSLAAKELPDFAMRYREVAADLARANTYHATAEVRTGIERLVASGHNALYREERRTWAKIGRFFLKESPAEIVTSWRVVLLAFAVFAAPMAGGFLLLREKPQLAYELLPDGMLERVAAGEARQARGETYYRAADEDLPMVASTIIVNNVKVAFNCFAGGIVFGIGSLFFLAYNGLILGAFAGHFANASLSGYLWSFIIGHGVLELFAIWVSGAAGFLLGRAIIAPGELPRGDAIALAGRRAMRMIGAVIILLIIAGLIEGFISAGAASVSTRITVSVTSLLFLVAYLTIGARSSVIRIQ